MSNKIFFALYPGQSSAFASYYAESNGNISKAISMWAADMKIAVSQLEMLSSKFANVDGLQPFIDNDGDIIEIANIPAGIYDSIKDLDILDVERCCDCGCELNEENSDKSDCSDGCGNGDCDDCGNSENNTGE